MDSLSRLQWALVCSMTRTTHSAVALAVTTYMPMTIELPATMLACARIGAVHSVVFGGFSADSLAQVTVQSHVGSHAHSPD